MNPRLTAKASLPGALLACLVLIAIAVPFGTAWAQQPPSWPCTFEKPVVSATVPNDTVFSDQRTLNCFAWQEFIGLNWPAEAGKRGVPDPKVTASNFGAPDASAPTVWETYKSDKEVFLPNGTKPKPWNNPPPPPHCATASVDVRAILEKPGVRVLSALSAFGDFVLDSTN